MDWKLQNNREKLSISRTKQFYRNLLVGNLEKLAKNRQVGRLVTNRQTDRQSTVTLVRMRAER